MSSSTCWIFHLGPWTWILAGSQLLGLQDLSFYLLVYIYIYIEREIRYYVLHSGTCAQTVSVLVDSCQALSPELET